MTLSTLKSKFGPTWPLGLVTVAASGTKVGLMSVVDPSSVNAPETATPGTAGADEYTVVAQQIIIRAVKSINPYVANAGAIYLLQAPAGSGTGNKTDSGVMVAVILPGETFVLSPATQARNMFSPYEYFLDADNSADGALVSLVII